MCDRAVFDTRDTTGAGPANVVNGPLGPPSPQGRALPRGTPRGWSRGERRRSARLFARQTHGACKAVCFSLLYLMSVLRFARPNMRIRAHVAWRRCCACVCVCVCVCARHARATHSGPAEYWQGDDLRKIHPLFGDDAASSGPGGMWDYEAAVERRQTMGGTSRSSVNGQIKELRTWLAK